MISPRLTRCNTVCLENAQPAHHLVDGEVAIRSCSATRARSLSVRRTRRPQAREGSSTKRNCIRINAGKGAPKMTDLPQPSARPGGSTGTSSARRRLTFHGRRYPLTIGGVSAGLVFGASGMDFVGTVRNIFRPSDVAGVGDWDSCTTFLALACRNVGRWDRRLRRDFSSRASGQQLRFADNRWV